MQLNSIKRKMMEIKLLKLIVKIARAKMVTLALRKELLEVVKRIRILLQHLQVHPVQLLQ